DRQRHARLRARLHARVTVPRQPAYRTPAIPLGKTTSRRGTEDDRGQPPHAARAGVCTAILEFGREVAVDLEADADLDEGRGRPGHIFLRWWAAVRPLAKR